MSKLYYDDPLIASYMNKEYGVKFKDSWNREIKVNKTQWDKFRRICFCVEGCNDWLDYDQKDGFPDKFDIHPDSYHIFQPQVGDLLESYYEPSCIEYAIYGGYETWLNIRSYWKILQRQNKHFFTPETGD